jgi:uncharacterized protein (DUF1697 family)
MRLQYVALLRAISNLSMEPFRRALEGFGFTDVHSYGMSGNLMFNTERADIAGVERDIAEKFHTVAIVRTRGDVARAAAGDPFQSDPRACMLFLAHVPPRTKRQAFLHTMFEGQEPQLRGRTLFFAWPLRERGKRAPFDLERVLGVPGTARTSRVVRAIAARMSNSGRA